MLKKDLIKENEELKAKLETQPKGNVVTDNRFYGVKYDEEFTSVAQTIAEGYIANAKGLAELSRILSASNVEIGAMVKFDN